MAAMIADDEVSLPSDSEEETVETKVEEITDLTSSDVVTKYQSAAKIANLALQGLVQSCVPGAQILDLCNFGEDVIKQSCDKVYGKKVNGKMVEKGTAFPVCISVNECICNNSPLTSEPQEPLKEGDVVKIDLGVHIDGYITVAAHTMVVAAAGVAPRCPTAPAGEATCGDVATAAYQAMLVASAMIKVGAKNTDVTKAMDRVATAYGVKCISNMRMHQMKRFVIEGKKQIALTPPNAEQGEEKVEEITFEANEVYAIDIAMSTGEGKGRETGQRTTVFKRNVENQYRLKMKASRYLLNEVNAKHATMPFSLRMAGEERQAKMGVIECVQHGMLTGFPVYFEKVGAQVAQFKATVLLLPSGTQRITGLDMPEYFTTTKTISTEEGELLATQAAEDAKKQAKKDKKKGKK